MFNHITLVGRLSRDPELRYTANGKALMNLTIPVNRYSGQGNERKQDTSWFSVQVWGETAEHLSDLAKGAMLTVSGRMEQQRWGEGEEQKERWVVVADRVVRLDKRPRED